MSNKTLINDLTTGNTTKKLLLFSWPFMLSNLLQMFYNLVDMIVVGQYVGSVGLSAVSNGGDALQLATMICIGFSSAGQVIISQNIGLGNMSNVRKTIGTIFTFMAAGSVLISIVGMLGMDWFMNAINVPEESVTHAKDYAIVCMWGLFFVYQYNAISAILRGMGESKRPLLFIAIATVSNLILDLIFVAGFRLGPRGAALATVMGQAISFICSIIYLYRRRESFGFDFKPRSFVIDKSILLGLLRLGLPMALQHCTISFSRLFVSSYINSYGLIVSAVNSVGRKISECAMVVSNALSSAGTSMIGQNLGAEKLGRISKTVLSCIVIGLSFSVILSLIMVLFPEEVFRLFTSESEVLAMSHRYVLVAVLNFFGFSLRSPMMALMNGVGNSILSFCIGIIDAVLGRILLAVFLGVILEMGIMGFWLGDVFAGYIPAIVGGLYFLSGRWKNRKPIIAAGE